MNNYGLTRENLLSTLPVALRMDESAVALADAIAGALALRPEEIDRLRIYPDIGRLDETMLDILAYDFKVDWWDGDYELEAKRRTLRDSWNVHRTLGTRYAVETALNDVYPGASISEWFEYGGTPYCFRISLPISGEVTLERQRRILSKVWYYKNLRSHLEAFQMELETSGNVRIGAYTMASETVEIWPGPVTGIEIGGAAHTAAYAQQVQTVEIYPD